MMILQRQTLLLNDNTITINQMINKLISSITVNRAVKRAVNKNTVACYKVIEYLKCLLQGYRILEMLATRL